MEICTLQIDSERYDRYCDVCEKLGAEPKTVVDRFFCIFSRCGIMPRRCWWGRSQS